MTFELIYDSQFKSDAQRCSKNKDSTTELRVPNVANAYDGVASC